MLQYKKAEHRGEHMAQTTKRALAASLVKLLKERSLDSITIKDIVEDCEVNRQTFYYHFQDIYDLLYWIFQTEAERVIGQKKDTETWREGFLRTFRYVQENRAMILHIFRSGGRSHLDDYLYGMVRSLLLDVVEENCRGLNVPEEDKHFISEFYKYAFVGMMLEWIAHDMKGDPEVLVDKTARLMEGEFRRALERFSK